MTTVGLRLESTVPLPSQKIQSSSRSSSSGSCSFHGHKLNRRKLYHLALLNNRSSFIPVRKRSPNPSPFSVAVGSSSSDALQPNQDDSQRKVPNVETLARRFWKVAAPYWFSEDKVGARWRLAAVFALTLGTTGISVCFNFLGRDFYNALANKDQEQFTKQLLYYLFGFATGIPVFVLRDYAKDTLSLRWRSWMTSYYMDRYLKNRTFYKIQSLSIIDNPDQRIVDDLSSFTGTALAFSLTIFNATVDLISFSNILYGIYPPLFLVLLGYSLGGTAISVFLGKGLVSLNFLQEKKEADFRYGLVRIRENAESIAFYGGEENEMQLLLQRFRSAFENLTKLLISSRNLEFFTNGYRYLIQILPAAVVAPMYFSGKIEFGVINQSVSAFNHILGDFSLVVYQFQSITAFSAVIDRLGEFDDLLSSSETKIEDEPTEEIRRVYCSIGKPGDFNGSVSVPTGRALKLLTLEHLTLLTPSNATLIRDLSLEICEGNHVLVTGPSGSGKTSLLRAVAGLWSYGRGTITFFERSESNSSPGLSADAASSGVSLADEIKHGDENGKSTATGVFFLPQKPYMVLGTLRQQLLYPTWSVDSAPSANSDKSNGSLAFLTRTKNTASRPKPTTDDIIKVLEDVRLGYIVSRFDLEHVYEWSSVLSIGEQQRLAFARLLLSKPNLVLLDESTSALDEANEAHLYELIEASGMTYISIGHRRTLYQYHTSVVNISPVEPTNDTPNWTYQTLEKDSVGSRQQ